MLMNRIVMLTNVIDSDADADSETVEESRTRVAREKVSFDALHVDNHY